MPEKDTALRWSFRSISRGSVVFAMNHLFIVVSDRPIFVRAYMRPNMCACCEYKMRASTFRICKFSRRECARFFRIKILFCFFVAFDPNSHTQKKNNNSQPIRLKHLFSLVFLIADARLL